MKNTRGAITYIKKYTRRNLPQKGTMECNNPFFQIISIIVKIVKNVLRYSQYRY